MYNNYNDTRVVPFAGPFLLGALTGGVAYSIFNNGKPTYVYPYYPVYPNYMYPQYRQY